MSSLILHPTTSALWHTLLHDAQQSTAIQLPSEEECYLLFLLMRFTEQPEMAHTILALDFLRGSQSQVSFHHQQQTLKNVGDQCLLFAGLFPGRAKRRRVKLSYFVKLGRAAYLSLGHLQEDDLFYHLAQDFVMLTDVLRATRANETNLLQSFEWWQETQSVSAWKNLCAATPSLANISHPQRKKH